MLKSKTQKGMLEHVKSIINSLRDPLITLDENLRVVTVNRSFYNFFKTKPENTVGLQIFELGNRQWNIPELIELLQHKRFDDYVVEHNFAYIGRRIMRLNAR